MPDDYLLYRVQCQDKNALDKLVRRYYDKIYSYCFNHVNDRQYAEDICQETFCSMLEHLDEYRHYGKFQNYLYVIARNKCNDFYKKKKSIYYNEIPEYEIVKIQAPCTENTVLMRELVHHLPKELEEAVILRFYQELKYQDIAKILEISNSVAKYRVKKAIGLLREELERGRECVVSESR